VAGSRGRSSVAAAVLGSVSTGILHHTRRPVLVVRGDE
jgi:nucleotide-binding universal stress UspA family protein